MMMMMMMVVVISNNYYLAVFFFSVSDVVFKTLKGLGVFIKLTKG